METYALERRMVDQVSREVALARRIGIFRPSDRAAFMRAFSTPGGLEAAFDAVVLYVEGWEKSDWLEEYRIERIGKWFAIAAPDKLVDQLTKWSRQNQNGARTALRRGITVGKSMPEDEKALILRKIA